MIIFSVDGSQIFVIESRDMGDRGNIVVRASKDNRDDVWFYTHWTGSCIKETAQEALKKKWRWTDASYLARIVFDELTSGNHDGEAGFGISASLGDNEWPILVIDCENQSVFLIEEKELSEHRIPADHKPKTAWTFEEFINLNLEE